VNQGLNLTTLAEPS